MRAQQRFLLGYFSVALLIFYSIYYCIVRGFSPRVSQYDLLSLKHQVPKRFASSCDVYFEIGTISTEGIARKVSELLISEDVLSQVLPLGDYRYINEVSNKASFVEPLDDLIDLSSPFSVLLRYDSSSSMTHDFEVNIHGGKLLTFSFSASAMSSSEVPLKVHDLVKRIFFSYDGMPSTHMTPLLDISFILMSDVRKLDSTEALDIIQDMFHPIASAMSLFYDLSFQSRVISGANFISTMTLNRDNNVDLQEQGYKFFDFMERVTNVEVGTVDTGIYRHSMAFICHVPEQPLLFYDRALDRTLDSVMLRGIGVLSLLHVDGTGTYSLGRDDISGLISSWVTYIRKTHNLDTTPVEKVARSLGPHDFVKLIDDMRYEVKSPGCTFQIRMHPPGLTAFYGFEVHSIAKSLYHLYLQGAIDTLHKVVKPLANISIMTRVSPSALADIRACHGIVNRLYGMASDSNTQLLTMARTAYKHSLEAISDDETYAKNAVSTEHGVASLMCDAFPFLFPLLANTIKYLTGK
ncbi:putative integral membrane protein [Babesia bovis T2Bo]|uniref:putative integral membrane protein n=1 Tax=Babesia bovis T2Bo TaxID=484906 RepID=UPI001C3505D2|nr:putative integral membrane protein [Babesia bovis T2Bo]EDO05123.2 putative integral membrane protein [Babesia bovis T2Bo]